MKILRFICAAFFAGVVTLAAAPAESGPMDWEVARIRITGSFPVLENNYLQYEIPAAAKPRTTADECKRIHPLDPNAPTPPAACDINRIEISRCEGRVCIPDVSRPILVVDRNLPSWEGSHEFIFSGYTDSQVELQKYYRYTLTLVADDGTPVFRNLTPTPPSFVGRKPPSVTPPPPESVVDKATAGAVDEAILPRLAPQINRSVYRSIYERIRARQIRDARWRDDRRPRTAKKLP